MPLDKADFEALKTAMLTLLPADGTPVLNRIMRVMLARHLKKAIDEETFFKARDALLKDGSVGRLRGQGGQVFLARSDKAPVPIEAPSLPDAWPEWRLMAPLRQYLDGAFRKNLDLPKQSAYVIRDTSVMGGLKGKWARPDFIVATAMRFKLMPGAQVDLHSFELKTESGGSVLAIHEALAQTRFTHFGHFVWHLPAESRGEAMLDDITTHCEEHGIGLIRMRDPLKPDDCEIIVDPRRKPTLASVVDGFLEISLSTEQKEALMQAIGGSA